MPTFMATPTDVMKLVHTARRLDANPFSLAGKLVGLGARGCGRRGGHRMEARAPSTRSTEGVLVKNKET